MTEQFLNRQHFEKCLNDALNQVFEGKGKERHGKQLNFEDQPWRFISDHVSPGFLTGQSVKKILELKNLPDPEHYKREILGAISYLVMALMYNEYKSNQRST